MCLFEDVTYCRVICDELEWNGQEGGTKVLVPVVGTTRGKEGELARKRRAKNLFEELERE